MFRIASVFSLLGVDQENKSSESVTESKYEFKTSAIC